MCDIDMHKAPVHYSDLLIVHVTTMYERGSGDKATALCIMLCCLYIAYNGDNVQRVCTSALYCFSLVVNWSTAAEYRLTETRLMSCSGEKHLHMTL